MRGSGRSELVGYMFRNEGRRDGKQKEEETSRSSRSLAFFSDEIGHEHR